MRNIEFTKVVMKNFLSIGEEPIVLDFKPGVHIITGVNKDKEDRRNGVGKSSIAESLYFAIFGTTLRELKKEFIINNITNGTCQVVLHFRVGKDEYIIDRTLSPSRLSLTKNGNDITRDSIANTNVDIQNLLSSTPEVFQNCVIMTLNNSVPFMSKSKTEKRKFIEQIFRLQVFSDMLSYVKTEYNALKHSVDLEGVKTIEISTSLNGYKTQKNNKKAENDKNLLALNKKIADNKDVLEILKQKLDNLVIPSVDAINAKIKTYDDALVKIDKYIENTQQTISNLTSDYKSKQLVHNNIGTSMDVCPTCLHCLNLNDKDHIASEKLKILNEMTSIKDALSKEASKKSEASTKRRKVFELKDATDDEKSKIDLLTQEKKNLAIRITTTESLIDQLGELVKQINDSTEYLDKLIDESEGKLSILSAIVLKLKNEMDLLTTVKFIVSEEGVKSFIVKKILQSINASLANYLKKLDSNSICIFNEYFEEEILNEKGKICVYNNFSGAEKKAIDLACLFSFMDIRKKQGDVAYNVSIYDELFDSSLDEKGVTLALDILNERATVNGECIFIISHRKESTKLVTGDIVLLEKENGITRRV